MTVPNGARGSARGKRRIDVTVLQGEGVQKGNMVYCMERRKLTVTYVLYRKEKEGQSFLNLVGMAAMSKLL
jgi:hypothetical protein